MANVYNPDKWLLVKIGGTDPHYRVFGSWSGGYLDGDSWRMNSGIVRVEDHETYWAIYGHSGSVYNVWKDAYGATAYGSSVVAGFADDDRFEVIDEPDNIMEMDWIIS